MLDWLSEGQLAAVAGAFGGVLLGLAARIGGFCTLGAIEDHLHGGSNVRLRMWGLAISFSILFVAVLTAFGLFTPADSIYLSTGWNPFAVIVGGLMFGIGMALTGHCCHGALARLGGGDLRAFVVVLVIGISAYMTIAGPIAILRVWLFPVTETPSASMADMTGVPFVWMAGLVGLAGTAWMLSSRDFLQHGKTLAWATVIAFAIASGWAATGWIASNGFGAEQVRSHSYAAPTGETLLYVMTMSGSYIDFGIGSVLGVIGGAFLGSMIRREFRWEACEDPRELRRQLFGAFLMGTGAVTAFGCSVGQGLSAFSVLAPSAPLLLISIYVGAAAGLRFLIEGFRPLAIRPFQRAGR
ncbi:YeeE/YedE family protein [Halovulum sp. GXIMD14794]